MVLLITKCLSREPMNLFSPRSDPEADEPFLPEHPIVTMEKGNIVDVPYMLGYALKEGAWRINYIAPDGVGSGEEWPHFIQDFNKVVLIMFSIACFHCFNTSFPAIHSCSPWLWARSVRT
jgi:hypothetical protein